MQLKHDAQHEQLMNMKQLRLELRQWANWWLRHEYGKGFSNRSSCDRLQDPVMFGTGGAERDIQPPSDVRLMTNRIDELTDTCRLALRAEYMCRGRWALCGFDSKKTFIFWLRRAELALVR